MLFQARGSRLVDDEEEKTSKQTQRKTTAAMRLNDVIELALSQKKNMSNNKKSSEIFR